MRVCNRVSLACSLFIPLLLASCSDGDKKLELGGSCVLNSDCGDPLVCTFGSCHQACHSLRDCPSGESCVRVDNAGVCQLPSEVACGAGGVCPTPLTCGADNVCRSACTDATQCSAGQTCVSQQCVDPVLVDAGSIDAGSAGTKKDAAIADAARTDSTLDVPVRRDAPATPIDSAPLACVPADCNDNLACTTDSCVQGACKHTVSTGCLIAGACVAAGAANTANKCQLCNPAGSTTAWTSATNGTSCGSGMACLNGTCQTAVCTPDQPCVPTSNPCMLGVTSCPSGAAGATTCTATTVAAPAGTLCGTGKVCDAAGACKACTEGGACTPTGKPCNLGKLSCADGAVCNDLGPAPAGTACGTGMYCNVAQQCNTCAHGTACTITGSCLKAKYDCTIDGTAVCVAGTEVQNDGASCGTNKVCSKGVCGDCVSGLVCTPAAPSQCKIGTIACTSGAPICTAGTLNRANGSECGTDMVCDSGVCTSCVAGGSCTSATLDPCAAGGVYSCATGKQLCVSGPANPAMEGQPCVAGSAGTCTGGVCQCPEDQTFAMGDCQPCPQFTGTTVYVNADSAIGEDNVCCGRTSGKAFGGACATIGQAIKNLKASGWKINVAGDTAGNLSALETYPITPAQGVTIEMNKACAPGVLGQPVVVFADGSTIQNGTLGSTCQAVPAGATVGIVGGGGGKAAGMTIQDVATGIQLPTGTLTINASGASTTTIRRVATGIQADGGTLSLTYTTNIQNATIGMAIQGTVDAKSSYNLSISDTTTGIKLSGGSLTYSGTSYTLSIVRADHGIVVDGGALTWGTISVSDIKDTGILCRSDNQATIASKITSSKITAQRAAKYDIFAGTGCVLSQFGSSDALDLALGETKCAGNDNFGLYMEGDAKASGVAFTINCMTQDGISLRANSALAANAPTFVVYAGSKNSVKYCGCAGVYAEVGKINLTNTTISHNHWGVIQRSALAANDPNAALVNLNGMNASTAAPNIISCNGKGEPGAVCPGLADAPGFGIWNNSGLPLNADNNQWDSSPVGKCVCDSALATCTCTGAAAGNATPLDKTSVVISPVNAGDPPGTVDFANYAAAPACN